MGFNSNAVCCLCIYFKWYILKLFAYTYDRFTNSTPICQAFSWVVKTCKNILCLFFCVLCKTPQSWILFGINFNLFISAILHVQDSQWPKNRNREHVGSIKGKHMIEDSKWERWDSNGSDQRAHSCLSPWC